jgi:hypothetical protein
MSNRENLALKEEIATLRAIKSCKDSEFDNINRKFIELQTQSTLLLTNGLV